MKFVRAMVRLQAGNSFFHKLVPEFHIPNSYVAEIVQIEWFVVSPNLGFWHSNCQRVCQVAGVVPFSFQVRPALFEGVLRVRVV